MTTLIMKRLRVNFDEIQKAMEDVVRDAFEYFLDLETGEVMALSEDITKEVMSRLGDTDEIEGHVEYIEYDEEPDLPYWMEDEIELSLDILLDESGRYVRIPERDSSEAHKAMTGFIETLQNPVLEEELVSALNGKGAFRRFKDVLIGYPKERKQWHGYNAKVMKKVITEWLHALGIEPGLRYHKKIKREGAYVRETEP